MIVLKNPPMKTQAREMLNLAFMAIGGKSFDELDEINEIPSYDDYLMLFTIHSDLKKISLKNDSFKKKILAFFK